LANSVASLFPNIAREWHKDNSLSPDQVSPGKKCNAKWICFSCNHVWEADIRSRCINKTGCPKCAKKCDPVKSVACLYPEIARECQSNVDLNTISPHSELKIKWKCGKCSRKWKAKVGNRIRVAHTDSKGCPTCSKKGGGRKLSYMDIEEICKLRCEGKTLLEIARLFGVSPQSIGPAIRRRDKPHNKPKMYTAHGETHSVREWATKLGVTCDVLRSRLKRNMNIENVLSGIGRPLGRPKKNNIEVAK
jgi:hypothetical protein